MESNLVTAVIWSIYQKEGKCTNFFELEVNDTHSYHCILMQRKSGDMSFYISWPSQSYTHKTTGATMYKQQAQIINQNVVNHVTQAVVAIFNNKDAQGKPQNYIAQGSTYYLRLEEKKKKAAEYAARQANQVPAQQYAQTPPVYQQQPVYHPAAPVYQQQAPVQAPPPVYQQPVYQQQPPAQQAPPQQQAPVQYPPQQQQQAVPPNNPYQYAALAQPGAPIQAVQPQQSGPGIDLSKQQF